MYCCVSLSDSLSPSFLPGCLSVCVTSIRYRDGSNICAREIGVEEIVMLVKKHCMKHAIGSSNWFFRPSAFETDVVIFCWLDCKEADSRVNLPASRVAMLSASAFRLPMRSQLGASAGPEKPGRLEPLA